ncbi:MAG: SelT/SelW/SelH family protein [Planctomycetes bacterium]|nr:SelT/SelW/SelH family protein [Planctomycetota bacterium]
MAEAIFNELRGEVTEIRLFPGRKSSFEVTCDDTLIFSKLNEGRFPNADEVLAAVG